MSTVTPFIARARRSFTDDDGVEHAAGTKIVALEALPLDAATPSAYIVEVFGFDGVIGELVVDDIEQISEGA